QVLHPRVNLRGRPCCIPCAGVAIRGKFSGGEKGGTLGIATFAEHTSRRHSFCSVSLAALTCALTGGHQGRMMSQRRGSGVPNAESDSEERPMARRKQRPG